MFHVPVVNTMLKLLLGVAIEVCVGALVAGLILALAVPVLTRINAEGAAEVPRILIVGVLVSALAIALFRPGSAINRYRKR
jgi:ABC-type enterobactin transport system permease subunit